MILKYALNIINYFAYGNYVFYIRLPCCSEKDDKNSFLTKTIAAQLFSILCMQTSLIILV